MVKGCFLALAIALAIASSARAESLQQLVTNHDSFTVGYLTFSNFSVTSMNIPDLTLNDINIEVERINSGALLHILTGPSTFVTTASGVAITYQVSGNTVDILSMGTGLVSQTYVNPIGRPNNNAFDNTVLFTTVSATWPNMPHGPVINDPRSPYYQDPRFGINRFTYSPFQIGFSELATDCHKFDPL